jgi:two-component system sensor histidine kinase YesM
MNPNNWRVRWKLSFIIGLAVLIVSILIGVCSYTISINEMKRNLHMYMGRFVNQLVVQFDTYFQDIDKLARAIWLNPEVLAYLTTNDQKFRGDWQIRLQIANLMSRQMYYRDGISGIFLILKDGTVIADSNQKQAYLVTDFPNLPDDASGTNQVFYPHRTGEYNTYVISYIRSLRDLSNGKLLGYLVIDIRLTDLETVIYKSTFDKGSEGYIQIVNTAHQTIYHPDRSFVGKEQKQFVISDGEPSVVAIDGNDYLLVSALSPYTQWHIVWLAPIKEVFQSINLIRNITFFIGLLAALVSVLISIRLSFYLTKPLEKLQEAMKQAEKGDLQTKAPVFYRDEVGQVALTFNKMLDKIEQLTSEIVLSETNRNQASIQEKQAQLNSLRSQINPHFLYNTLDTLMGMTLLNKRKELHDGLEALSRMFHYSLSSQSVVTLKEELEHARDYFTIIELRFNQQFSMTTQVDEELLLLKISPLILQPLIENSVRHGLEPSGGTGTISIKARRIGSLLSLRVEDNGVGVTPERLMELQERLCNSESKNPSSSIGLLNVFSRIKLIYGNQAQMTIDAEEGCFTRVHLLIPLSE